MAQVWEATDTVLDRVVAVKVLHPHLAGDPTIVGRFRDEAKAAARLSHQSIVAIYDTASENGIEAIVMEMIDGMTLRQYLDEYGPLALPDAVDLTNQVANALDAAHEARIVHRDIKPANIILGPDRRIKVTDFGIAKALEGGDTTTEGTLLGTAKYLAPEQVEGKPVDQRADVYGLGVVLFEALTGRVPFQEDSDSATALARLRTDPPSPRSFDPSISPAVERIVLTALARNRDRRFTTAGSLRDALGAAVADPDAAALSPTTFALLGDPTTSGPVPVLASDIPAADEQPRTSRSLVGPLLITLVIVGSLALGVGLILATGMGRDFFERVGDRIGGNDGVAESAGTAVIDLAETEQPATSAVAPAEDPVEPLAIVSLQDFDPLGDDGERPDLLALAIDGDSTTVWNSESYTNRSFGNLKDGVGLVITVAAKATMSELNVTSPSEGWAASVFALEAPAAVLSSWGDPLDAQINISGSTTFDLRGIRATAVLLWITDLGDGPPNVRIDIAELGLA